MAVLAFAAAGAAIGSTVGYASLGWAVGSLVGQTLFPGKLPDQNVSGPRFSDLRVQTSAYGQMVPIVAGPYRLANNVVWAKPVQEVVTTTSQSSGGKGGGPKQTVNQTTYAYFADFAILLGEGPASGVRKLWIQGELKYNVADSVSSETIFASALNARAVRFYPGTEDQEQDALIAAHEGVDDCPAYRGSVLMVVEGMDVTEYGARIPQIEAELVTAGTLADLAVPTAASLGASDGSTAIVLGGNGHVYAGATTVGGYANRWSFYTGAKASTYVPASYTHVPVGVTPSGDAIATGHFGGTLTVLHQDGSQTAYTGGWANMGSGGILASADNRVWWCRGDSSSSQSLFRVDVGDGILDDVKLSGFFTLALARNGLAVAGRCYILGSLTSGGQVYIGYAQDGSLSFVPLVPITGYAGFLVTASGTIWFGPNNSAADRDELHQYSADGVLLQTITLPTTASAGWDVFEDRTGLIWAVGLTGFGSNRRAYCINPGTGELLHTSQDFVGTPLGFTDDNRFVVWDSTGGAFALKEIERLPRLTADAVQLDDFVTSLASRVGLAPSDLDLAELSGIELRGYAIARRDTVRGALEPLMLAHNFDLVESDGQIRAVLRGAAPIVVIPEADLAARAAGAAAPAPVANTRRLETELPREVSVRYVDADADYAIGTQYARRLTGSSFNVQTVDLPLVLTAAEAAAIADRVLYEAWAARNSQEIVLPRKYLHLDPADVVQIVTAGTIYTVRLAEVNQSGGLVRVRAETLDVDVYTPAAGGAALPSPGAEVGPAGPTELHLLDVPILRDADDAPGVYAAAAGYYAGWRGAELWASADAGATYARTTTAFLVASVVGSVATVLPNFTGGNIFDALSTVEVQVRGELASDSEANVLAGANAALVGNEIIQFRTATLVSAGRYRLTGLLRGRRGTEQHMGTHAIGDRFVLLSAAALQRVAGASADIGAAKTYKAPGFGQALADAAAIAFTDTGVGLKPLAPVQLGGGRNAAGDVLGSFVRRTRVGGEWRDYVDAQLGEASESYEVEIWTSGFATLKRTITGLTTPAFTYTSAQQVTDFGSNQATVYVRVYQISAVVGRGFALQGTI